jgi:hypothetical protein
MRKTTDTKTGKSFRWNIAILVDGLWVPGRRTSRGTAHLQPDRVLPNLLWRLNRKAIDATDMTQATQTALPVGSLSTRAWAGTNWRVHRS